MRLFLFLLLLPVRSSKRVRVDESQEGKSPDHNDLGGDDLIVDNDEYAVDEFPKRKSENPADGDHSAKRRDSDGEPLLAKRLRDDYVANISEDQTVNQPLDYSCLMELDELDLYNKSEYSNEEVAAGKIVGLKLLDEHTVYGIEPRENAKDKPFVDSTWAIAPGKAGLKCRLVGSEYKWASERTDVFAAASNPTMGRIIHYCSNERF